MAARSFGAGGEFSCVAGYQGQWRERYLPSNKPEMIYLPLLSLLFINGCLDSDGNPGQMHRRKSSQDFRCLCGLEAGRKEWGEWFLCSPVPGLGLKAAGGISRGFLLSNTPSPKLRFAARGEEFGGKAQHWEVLVSPGPAEAAKGTCGLEEEETMEMEPSLSVIAPCKVPNSSSSRSGLSQPYLVEETVNKLKNPVSRPNHAMF